MRRTRYVAQKYGIRHSSQIPYEDSQPGAVDEEYPGYYQTQTECQRAEDDEGCCSEDETDATPYVRLNGVLEFAPDPRISNLSRGYRQKGKQTHSCGSHDSSEENFSISSHQTVTDDSSNSESLKNAHDEVMSKLDDDIPEHLRLLVSNAFKAHHHCDIKLNHESSVLNDNSNFYSNVKHPTLEREHEVSGMAGRSLEAEQFEEEMDFVEPHDPIPNYEPIVPELTIQVEVNETSDLGQVQGGESVNYTRKFTVFKHWLPSQKRFTPTAREKGFVIFGTPCTVFVWAYSSKEHSLSIKAYKGILLVSFQHYF